jgi:hypothetical protein
MIELAAGAAMERLVLHRGFAMERMRGAGLDPF